MDHSEAIGRSRLEPSNEVLLGERLSRLEAASMTSFAFRFTSSISLSFLLRLPLIVRVSEGGGARTRVGRVIDTLPHRVAVKSGT